MTLAFVLISTLSGRKSIPEVKKKVEKIPQIKEAHMVFGSSDILVKAETESLTKLTELVEEIRSNDSVGKTETLTVWGDEFKK